MFTLIPLFTLDVHKYYKYNCTLVVQTVYIDYIHFYVFLDESLCLINKHGKIINSLNTSTLENLTCKRIIINISSHLILLNYCNVHKVTWTYTKSTKLNRVYIWEIWVYAVWLYTPHNLLVSPISGYYSRLKLLGKLCIYN